MHKDAGMRIRIERDLRDDFVEICRMQGYKASTVIREFMEKYVTDNTRRIQPDIFAEHGGER